jgi:tetratricopeptide (TPR) repeat protein
MPAPDPFSNFQIAQSFKEAGNRRFKNGEYTAAMGQYHRAVIFLKSIYAGQNSPLGALGGQPSTQSLPTELLNNVNQLYADCQANIAACLLQAEKPSYSRVVECCTEAVGRIPSHSKAHYRQGVALYHLHRYDDAMTSLQKAAKLQKKSDANIVRYMELCRKGLVEQEKQLRSQCQAMFASPT